MKWGRFPIWWTQRLREAGAGIMARDVLVILAAHASGETREAYPSIATIAKMLGVGERAVKRALAELITSGIVKRTIRNRRAGESNIYKLATTEPFQVTSPGPLGERADPLMADRLGERFDPVLGERIDPVLGAPVEHKSVREHTKEPTKEQTIRTNEGKDDGDEGVRAEGAADGHRPLEANGQLTAALLTLGISRSVADKLVAENADRARDWSLFTLDRLPEDTRNPAAWITASIQRDEWPPAPPKPQPKLGRFFYDPNTREEIRY
jgi:Mn-dependent DtxR family transcriptional regulator